MLNGRWSALEYKTQRTIVGQMKDRMQTASPTPPKTVSKGKPQNKPTQIGSFQNAYWRAVINITVKIIPSIKGPSMVPGEICLSPWPTDSRPPSWKLLEAGNARDRRSETLRGSLLQVTLLTYPRQKYVVPKVQFLGITEPKSLWIAVIALDTTV